MDTDRYALAAVVLLWLILVPLVNPKGNMPLNDDWCYARVVYDLLHDHQFRLAGITSMTLIAQVIWGLLFCAVLGPSFVALRISTLVLALGGLLATHGLLREVGAPRWTAVFGCAVLALNPFYLCLSYTFMTDVPFVAVSLMCMYAYARALKHDSIRWIIAGTALACAATLIRQIGVFLPVGFGLAYLVSRGLRLRSIPGAVLPTAATAAVLQGYLAWLKAADLLPPYFNIQGDRLSLLLAAGPRAWLQVVSGMGLLSFVFVGLWLLPFLILVTPRSWETLPPRRRWVNLAFSVISAVAVWAKLASEQRWMPIDALKGDYVWDFGIGPSNLRDVWEFGLQDLPRMPVNFWIAVTVAGVLGGALLVWHLLDGAERLFLRARERCEVVAKSAFVMLIAVCVMNLVVMMVLMGRSCFDRYYLPVIPLFMAAAGLVAGRGSRANRRWASVGLVALLLIGWFAIGGTHDYMAWNRLRWRAAGQLMREQHVSFREIGGGPEFDAWYGYRGGMEWWPGGSKYVIAFGPIPGYKTVKEYPYRRWMPPGDAAILVLRGDL